MLTQYLSQCPRCGNGEERAKYFEPVFEEAYNILRENRGEVVRTARLLRTLTVLKPQSRGSIDDLIDPVLKATRDSDQAFQARGALYGLYYYLLGQNLDDAVRLFCKPEFLDLFGEQDLALQLFTAFTAAIGRGTKLESIRRRYPILWKKYENLHIERSPASHQLLELLPALQALSEGDLPDERVRATATGLILQKKNDKPLVRGQLLLAATLALPGEQSAVAQASINAAAKEIELLGLNFVPVAPLPKIWKVVGKLGVIAPEQFNDLSETVKIKAGVPAREGCEACEEHEASVVLDADRKTLPCPP